MEMLPIWKVFMVSELGRDLACSQVGPLGPHKMSIEILLSPIPDEL